MATNQQTLGQQAESQHDADQQADQQHQEPTESQKKTAAATEAELGIAAPKRNRGSNAELLQMIVAAGGDSQMYARQIVEAELSKDMFDQDWRLARVFATSGQFSDLKGITEMQAIATAMAKIQLGRNWNLNPSDSMQFVYFTNGRPAVMNELFAAKMRDSGMDWDIEFLYPTATQAGQKKRCIGCVLYPKRWDPQAKRYEPILDRAGQQVQVSFDKEDADAAMIWEKGKQIPLSAKWNFVAWAEDMYFWRSISRLRRRYATNVLSGAIMREEAEELPPADRPMGGTVGLHQFRQSPDENRGHDAAAPPKDSGNAETPAPSPTETLHVEPQRAASAREDRPQGNAGAPANGPASGNAKPQEQAPVATAAPASAKVAEFASWEAWQNAGAKMGIPMLVIKGGVNAGVFAWHAGDETYKQQEAARKQAPTFGKK